MQAFIFKSMPLNNFSKVFDFRPLNHVPTPQLIEVFNEAFSTYFVPVALTPAIFEQKRHAEQLNTELSIGAFHQEQLVGFMLHGVTSIGETVLAYNGGTGVIPNYRGFGLTKKMYRHQIHLLANRKVEKVCLEVIVKNEPAIRAYQHSGFSISRSLNCYKGNYNDISAKAGKWEGINIEILDRLPWQEVMQYWDYQPTWQNQIAAVDLSMSFVKIIGLKKEGKLLAYGIINPEKGRILQFAVHPSFRRQGLARLLFKKMGELDNPNMSILNVEDSSMATNTFLKSIGFQQYIQQYEMYHTIK